MKVRHILAFMTGMVNPKATRRLTVSYAFRFSGDEPGDYTLIIDRGTCRLQEGWVEKPTVAIEVPSQVWLAISQRTMTFAEAKRSGQLKIHGNRWRMMRFNHYFSGDADYCEVEKGLYASTDNEIEQQEKRWTVPKRILGIQASPRTTHGETEWVYSSLIQGMQQAGATVDTVYLADKHFGFCRGCYACWKSKDGRCTQQDDLTDLIPAIPNYDLLILATPLYVDGMTGLLKAFIDRWIVLGHPTIIAKENRCRHPSRYQRMPNLVLVSVCGFLEMESFDPLVQHVQAISINTHMPLIASILRPAAGVLKSNLMQGLRQQVIQALQNAGKELVTQGKVPADSMKTITQSILSRGQYMAGARGWWKKES